MNIGIPKLPLENMPGFGRTMPGNWKIFTLFMFCNFACSRLSSAQSEKLSIPVGKFANIKCVTFWGKLG
ncbi:hypothetical protein DPMN_060452 [Dreissena polymorpha]|uniref:Uncharacterized protein n=1 Tax=Dreissena polymorpha TaxID=45954 RepID=A0A9D4C590_DREPO|nr:hypothetical protein DPMN_060452 [Dreissena polymorpha]